MLQLWLEGFTTHVLICYKLPVECDLNNIMQDTPLRFPLNVVNLL